MIKRIIAFVCIVVFWILRHGAPRIQEHDNIYDRPGKILPKSIFFLILVIDIFPFCKCIGGGLFWN